MTATDITFTLNGKPATVHTEPERPLLDVLREDLQMTGTKYGCGEGMCRACTVLLDDQPILSCLTPVSAAENKSIITIEGLAKGDALHPVQQAFLDEGRMQCGYCMPGMIMQTAAMLKTHPHPTDEQIVTWLNGHVCRCCGYPAIVQAVHRAAGKGAPGEASHA